MQLHCQSWRTRVPGEIPSEDSPGSIPVEVEEPSRKGPIPEQIIAVKVTYLSLFSIFSFKTLSSQGLGAHSLKFKRLFPF